MNGTDQMDSEGPAAVPEAEIIVRPPAMPRYYNANHKLVVYMTLAFRMRDGASPERIVRTIARMDPSQVTPEVESISAFASLLSERTAEALKRPDALNPPRDETAPGLVYAIATEVFGPESVGFVEQISLDVPTSEMLQAAMRSGDAEHTMHRIAADILRNTAEVLRASIEPRK